MRETTYRRPPADRLLRRRQLCTGQGWGPCPHGRGQCASPSEPLAEKPILGLAVETSAGIPKGLRAWGAASFLQTPGLAPTPHQGCRAPVGLLADLHFPWLAPPIFLLGIP